MPARAPRRLAVVASLALILGVLVATPAFAVESWSLTVTPAEVRESKAVTYSVGVTNDTSSPSDKIGCVELTIPSGYTNVGTPTNVVASENKDWAHVSNTGTTVVQLAAATSGDRLGNANRSFTFDITATSPGAGDTTWSATAFSDLDCTLGEEYGGVPGGIRTQQVAVNPNQPPTVPTLASPADDATTTDQTPTFTWNASTDTDPPACNGCADPIHYRIQAKRQTTPDACTGTSAYTSPEYDLTTGVAVLTATPGADLAEGVYCWHVAALDDLDASSAYSTPRLLRIDLTPEPPAAPVIGTKPSNPSGDTNPVFTFTSTDPTAIFQCKIDDGAYTVCSSGDTFPVTDGARTFSVRALDESFTPSTAATYTWSVDSSLPADTVCGILGTEAADALTGTPGDDVICGLGGVDIINGLGGNDTIYGGSGNDLINGGADLDTILGGAGGDQMDGSDGFDIISYATSPAGVQVTINAGGNTGGHAAGDILAGAEAVYGSNFEDTLTGDGLPNSLFGGGATDTINGLGGNDSLLGEGGDDAVNGGLGDDTIYGNGGGDTIDGGDGTDTISYQGSPAAVQVTVNALTGNTGGDGAGDSLLRTENLRGSDHNDLLTGDGAKNILNGFAGNDVVNGAGGADSVTGGEGNDQLSGGTENDTLTGEAGDDILAGDDGVDTFFGGIGADTMDGGAGVDVVSYQSSLVGVDVTLGGPAEGNTGGEAASDKITTIENLTGSNLNDELTGDGTGNSIRGLGGVDVLRGLGGNDSLTGGAGNDDIAGGTENDTLTGEAGDDLLAGDAGVDTFFGGTGADTMDGGAGTDVVSYQSSTAGVDVTLGGLAIGNTGGEAAGDQITTIENLTGSNLNDVLTGDDLANSIRGLDGNDILRGAGGNDALDGGPGTADTCDGGTGTNTAKGCP